MTKWALIPSSKHFRKIPSQHGVDAFVGDDDALVRRIQSDAARLPHDSMRAAELPCRRRISQFTKIPNSKVTFLRAEFSRTVFANDHFLAWRVHGKWSLCAD